MEIDLKLLDKCPRLTDYEKDLIRRVDVRRESQSSAAKHYEKKPSTISIQHKKAVARFDEWVQNKQREEKVASKDDFDKQVFRMFRRGDLPDKVIEKLGNVERVLSLWEKYRRLREDDYLRAIDKLAKYGFEIDRNTDHPLSDRLENVLFDHWSTTGEEKRIWKLVRSSKMACELQINACESLYDAFERLIEGIDYATSKGAEAKDELESALERNREHIERIVTVERENRELSKLRKYDDLTDEQLQQRETRKQELEEGIRGKEIQLSTLEQQVDHLKRTIFDLNTTVQERVKEFLAELDTGKICQLITQAKLDRMKASFMNNLAS